MKDKHLLTKDIRKTFFKYLTSSIGGMLGVSLYVLGDTMIVGRGLGSQGLAALNISIPLINVFNGLGLLFGIGGATLLSVNRGRGDNKSIDDIFSKSMVMAFVAGIILTLIRVFFLDELVYFLGASTDTFDMARDYLGVLMTFSLMFLLNSALTVFVRNDGSPRLAMIGMLTGSIVNVILDYVFIIKMGLGMAGGAFATGLSPVIGLVILSFHFLKKRNKINFILVRPDLDIIKRIIANGSSSFVIELSAGIVIFAFNQSLLKISGDIAISAYSIIANLSLIFSAIFIGVGQGIQPIVSFNFGAERLDRVYETIRLGIFTSLGLGAFFYALGLFFPEALVSIFIDADKELLDLTVQGIRIYFSAFIFMGLNIVLTSFMQSKEYSKSSFILSISRGFILVIIALMILPRFLGIRGVWMTLPVVEFLTTIIAVFRFKKYRKALIYSFKK